MIQWPDLKKKAVKIQEPLDMSTLFIHCYQGRLVMKATEKVQTKCCCSLCWVTAPWLSTISCFLHIEAWENSGHFTSQPLVSPQNDVWEMTIEIPHWWCTTTQIRVVPLIGWKIASSNQKRYPDLGSDRSSVWNSCGCFSDIISKGTSGGVRKCGLFLRLYLHTETEWINTIMFLPVS